jgi:Ca2+-binding RTX toxin-like protein
MIKNGNAGNNNLIGGNDADYLSGRGGDDFLDGAGGNDFLYGGDGIDVLADGAGQDQLYGQDGDDTFIMANGEVDVVDGGAGLDVVYYSAADTGPTVVDFVNSSLNSGAAAGDQLVSIEGFFGSSLTDIVSGNDNLNLFYASFGDDRYDGRGGQDLYYGYNWNPSANIQGFEIAFGTRANALATAAGIAAPPAGSAVAYFELWVDGNSNGIKDAGEISKYADVLTSIEYFVGTDGNDKMTGSAADETFSPLTGVNTVNGGAGIDVLSYNFLDASIDGLNGVTVDLAAGWAKLDQQSTITNIENVNGSAWNDVLMGSAGVNVLMGLDGDDALDGRGGNDELHGGKGNDILVGGDGNDILSGGDGEDLIDGGAGTDTLSYASASTAIAVSLIRGEGLSPTDIGFSPASNGDSILNVENVVGSLYDDIIAGSDGNNVLEGRTGDDTINGCGGNDIIYGDSNSASAVPEFVPEPSLSDTNIIDDCDCDASNFDGSTPAQSFDDTLYGAEGNDTIYGQLGDDHIAGGTGNDILQGNEGNDIIEGGDGADRIDGGLGTDFLDGGTGNDTISGGAGFDIIFGGIGSDTVDYSASPSAVTANLGQFWLNSGGDASTDLLAEIMTQLADGADPSTVFQSSLFLSFLPLIAADGTNTAFTLGLPDVIMGVENLTGSNFNDSLTGDAFANILTGNNGNDILDGMGGNDTLIGGNGNDLYRVDSTGDVVTEASSTGGTDTVESTATFTLSANVENLVLLGDGAINGTGNALANTITGNAANNVLNGGAGADKMTGGDGNDTYSVDNVGDQVIETATGGIDLVGATVSYTLSQNVENLNLNGSAVINGTGNSIANTINGNAMANSLYGLGGDDRLNGLDGNDRLVGGAGNDALRGGGGADTFIFDSGLSASTNVDSILDFVAADDTIQLQRSVFTGIAADGTLAASAFQIGTAANDSADRIIYDQATGRIFYDSDGAGGASQVLFATVTAGTVLTNADFVAASGSAQIGIETVKPAGLTVQIAIPPESQSSASSDRQETVLRHAEPDSAGSMLAELHSFAWHPTEWHDMLV